MVKKSNTLLGKSWLVFATPLFAGSVFTTSPGLAATFANSSTQVFIDNFSHDPFSSFTETLTDTVVTLEGTFSETDSSQTESISVLEGSVAAVANAQALLVTANPALAVNSTLSQAISDSFASTGLATSEATIIGDFFLDGTASKPETFSFQFELNSRLETSIDYPSIEKATTIADTLFLLVDSTDPNPENQEVIDFFSLSTELNTLGDDLIELSLADENNNFVLAELNPFVEIGRELKQELVTINAQGWYERQFDQPTKLTLIETKRNSVYIELLAQQKVVKTPENSGTLALLAGLISMIFGIKNRQKSLK